MSITALGTNTAIHPMDHVDGSVRTASSSPVPTVIADEINVDSQNKWIWLRLWSTRFGVHSTTLLVDQLLPKT